MNQSKVQRVPFAWENQAGVSKVTPHDQEVDEGRRYILKLPPPPCQKVSTDSPRGLGGQHDLHVPLPPCPFIPPPMSRSSSRRTYRGENDPFLAAYKECTKSTVTQGKLLANKHGRKGFRSREGKFSSMFSCKQSSGVIEGGLIRKSQFSPSLGRDGENLDSK